VAASPAPGIIPDDAARSEGVDYKPLDIPPVALQEVLGHGIFALQVAVFDQFFAL